MNNFKNLTKGIASGIINKIVGLLLPFVSRTVLIYTLGLSYVGLNSLFSSVLQVLNFSELGLGSAIVYLLYKPLAENNTVQVNRILSFCKTKRYSKISVMNNNGKNHNPNVYSVPRI